MIVYDGLKSDFLHSVEADTIALEIEQNILEKREGILFQMNSSPGTIPCSICTKS